MRSRATIPDDELKTGQYYWATIISLALLGGQAHIDAIKAKVGVWFGSQMGEPDHRLMCHMPHGEDYAPVGFVGETWEVWEGKVSILLGAHLVTDGVMTRKNNVFTLTEEGWKKLKTFLDDFAKAYTSEGLNADDEKL